MDIPFSAAAEALRDITRWERFRIQHTLDLANVGRAHPIPGVDLAGWKERLARLEALLVLIEVLVEHEPAVRQLDPRLERIPQPAALLPTMWG